MNSSIFSLLKFNQFREARWYDTALIKANNSFTYNQFFCFKQVNMVEANADV